MVRGDSHLLIQKGGIVSPIHAQNFEESLRMAYFNDMPVVTLNRGETEGELIYTRLPYDDQRIRHPFVLSKTIPWVEFLSHARTILQHH